MLHHADLVELKRRKARLEDELQRLNQQLQSLRRLRAQITGQQMDLLRVNGPKSRYDELQQHYLAILKLTVATIEEQSIIDDLLLQFDQILARPAQPPVKAFTGKETLKSPLLHLTRLDGPSQVAPLDAPPAVERHKSLIPF